jgi:hypothetical protein
MLEALLTAIRLFMQDLTPKEVAAWFRKQGKQHAQLAKDFEQMASMAERTMMVHWASSPGPTEEQPQGGVITAEQIEARIRRKSARIGKIAHEFGVSQKVVAALLEPNSKVYEGERGWLKLRG